MRPSRRENMASLLSRPMPAPYRTTAKLSPEMMALLGTLRPSWRRRSNAAPHPAASASCA